MQIKLGQVSIGAIVILAAITAVVIFMRTPGYIDFFFNGARYGEIVKAMKAFPLPNASAQSFQTDPDLSPSSIKPSTSETETSRSSRGQINVERNAEGDYLIELIKVDDGHYGFAGYIFWDKSLADNEQPPQPAREPGHIYKKINDHWWAFHNHES